MTSLEHQQQKHQQQHASVRSTENLHSVNMTQQQQLQQQQEEAEVEADQQQQQPQEQQETPVAAVMADSTSSGTVEVEKNSLTEQNISYSAERIIGNGSFGVVFEAKVVETGEVVAIKKVLQDKRFKNRELQIMRQLVKDPHPNIVALKHCFYSQVRTEFCYCWRFAFFFSGKD